MECITDDESLYTMKKLYKALDKHGTPPIQCVQRIVCTLVKKASLSKKQSSSDKIVDGLARYYI